MIRTICILILSVLFNISYAEQSTSKLNNVDISCLAQLYDLKNNPTEEKLSGMLETLMANTSNSKLTLYTIEKCTAELQDIIQSNENLKPKKYLLDYFNSIVTYCKGDSLGFVNQIEALKFQLLQKNKFVECASINVQAGNFFSLYNVVDLRFKFYRDNIVLFNKHKNVKWEEYDIQNYNSIGFLFETIEEYDSALKYYNIGLDLAEKNGSKVWYGLMSGNMGSIYLINKDYKRAEQLLSIDLAVSKQYKMNESALNVMFHLMQIKNAQKKYSESQQLLDSVKLYMSNIDIANSAFKTLFINNFNFSKAEIFMGIGKYDSARYYYKKSNDYLYSLNKDYRKREKSLLNKRYNFEENAEAFAELETKNKQTLFIAIITFLLLASTTVILVILSNFNKKSKQKSMELEELILQKDKLFSIVSHDLKSPLNTLYSLLDLYNIDAISNDDFLKYKADINKSINEISNNLNNVLLWASQSMKTGLKVNNSEVDLSVLLNEIINQFSMLINNKNLNLLIENKFNDKLIVDRNMLFVILSNLLNNAIKFTKEHKSIFINIEKPLNNNLQIIVEDHGVGIKKDKLDSIFKLQANKSTMGTYGEKGTGLGLIICNDFIKLMGGTIKVESTLNVGTKFIVNLPIN